MTQYCICQICNCGRHRCPLHPNKPIQGGGGDCSLSEYANRYHSHPLETRKPIKPEYKPPQDQGPLQDKTTNKADYVEHPLEQRMARPKEEYLGPTGDFDGVTSYKNEFIEKPFEKTKSAKRVEKRSDPGKFDGIGTYQHDYPRKEAERRGPIKQDNEYRPNVADWDARPTYQTDYLPKVGERARSMKPAEAARASDSPFDGLTGYKQEYVKHPLEERVQREKDVYQPSSAPLEGLSNYMNDFVPRQGEMTKSCRPDRMAYKSEIPFSGDTTTNVDYKPWEASRPQKHEPERYVKPAGEMEKQTTSHMDYVRKVADRTQSQKPTYKRSDPGQFADDTTHKIDFQKWKAPEREAIKRGEEYVPPGLPFEGITDYQDNFIPRESGMRRSMKPVYQAPTNQAPFDGSTMYRADFVPKEVEPCPASLLDKPASKFSYKQQDITGHKFYQPISSTIQDLQANGGGGNNQQLNQQMAALYA